MLISEPAILYLEKRPLVVSSLDKIGPEISGSGSAHRQVEASMDNQAANYGLPSIFYDNGSKKE